MKFWQKISSKLGTCSRCVRSAFLVAACSWLASALLFSVGEPHLFMIGLAAASCSTALWFAHILVYANRRLRRSESGSSVDSGRRNTILWFIRFVGLATAASLPTSAFAWSGCGGFFQGDCDPCERRLDANNLCESCRSCGNDCGDYVC